MTRTEEGRRCGVENGSRGEEIYLVSANHKEVDYSGDRYVHHRS